MFIIRLGKLVLLEIVWMLLSGGPIQKALLSLHRVNVQEFVHILELDHAPYNDSIYYSTSNTGWKIIKFLIGRRVGRAKYEAEIWDCDDFAADFMVSVKKRTRVNAVGVVTGWRTYDDGSPSVYHAWNIFMPSDQSKGMRMLEPQTGKEVDHGYLAERVSF
jgi:hypothetical protein